MNIKYVKDLPKNVIDILLAILEKDLIKQGCGMMTIFEKQRLLLEKEIDEIDKEYFIAKVFQS